MDHEALVPAAMRVMWEPPEVDGGAAGEALALLMSTDLIKFKEINRGSDTEFEACGLSAVYALIQVVAGNFGRGG